MKSAWVFLTLVATLAAGLGHNNWDKPCFDGECAYDIPDHKGQSGTVKLFASNPHAIADITAAAGWVVLDCDPQALVQDIRLVCKGDGAEGAGCDHLFNDAGPVDKYVRLPESCSQSSFGRIHKFWVHADQSVPEHHGVVRRDNVAPQVFAISIDDKFDQIDYTKHGDVRYIAYGVNAPGVDVNFDIPNDISSTDTTKGFLTDAVDYLHMGLKDTRAGILLGHFPATPGIDLPSDSEKNKSNIVKIGSSSTPLLPLRLESDHQICESSGYGTTTTASLSVSLNIDTYLWGTGKWGGAVSGVNGVVDAILGFLEDFDMNMKHVYTVSAEISGEFKWEYDTPQLVSPRLLLSTWVQLGLMGGVKVAMAVNANAEAKVTSTVQYGLQHLSITIPPKKNTRLIPYFNSTPIDALFSGEVSASVGVTGGITPMLMVGVASSGGSARADAWLGVEVGLSLSAQATQAFGSGIGSDSPSAGPLVHGAIPSSFFAPGPLIHEDIPPSSSYTRPSLITWTRSTDDTDKPDVELNYCAKLDINVKAGAEAKVTWKWLHRWIGWNPSVSADLNLFTHQWVLSESPGFCSTQTRRSHEETSVSNRSVTLLKRAAPTKPSSTTKPASCLPKGILGKAKSFLHSKAPLATK